MRSARLRRGSGVSRTCGVVSLPPCRQSRNLNSVTHVLHDANGLLGLANKLILSLLNLGPRLFAQILVEAVLASGLARQRKGAALGIRLCGIEAQARVLDGLAGAGRELDVGVERGAPAGEEAALDLGVLGQAGLADLLAGDGVLLEARGKRVLARARLLRGEHVRGIERGARNGVAERLGLRLGRGRRRQSLLGFGGRGGARQQRDLLRDGAAQVVERLADVGRVVVGLVGVLRRDLQHRRVHLLQRVDTLLQLNVVGRQLRLVLDLADLLLDVLLRPGGPWRKGRPVAAWSAQTMSPLPRGRGLRDVLSKRRNLAEILHDDVCGGFCLECGVRVVWRGRVVPASFHVLNLTSLIPAWR